MRVVGCVFRRGPNRREWRSLSPREDALAQRCDVIVVGGGVVGVCTAYSLVERGVRTTLLERGEICSGASHGNGGWIFPSESAPIPG
ncbi:MAG: FAD-dependent oxidoreductase, partial [Acidobacteria bacterium]|nr:FAD-dependent oxidoreductase [Acidobacteriota bacterium]